MSDADIVLIGGGVVNLAIAYNLSSQINRNIVLFEKSYLGNDQSGRNSGVIHSGLYYQKGSEKARLCVKGNKLLYEFCQKHGVPCKNTGKMIVAQNPEDETVLKELENSAHENNVEAYTMSENEIHEKETNVHAKSALFVPSTGIIDSASYVKKLHDLSVKNNVMFFTNTPVINIRLSPFKEFRITAENNGNVDTITSKYIINGAGLYSDEIANIVNNKNNFSICPVRGEYYKFNASKRNGLEMNGTCVYTTPKYFEAGGKRKFSVGVHLTPTFGINREGEYSIGNIVRIGPNAKSVSRKNDYDSDRDGPETFFEDVKTFFPNLQLEDLEMDYAGIRAKSPDGEDFLIKRDDKYHNCIHLLYMDSPALTSSLAIADHVGKMMFLSGDIEI